MQFQWKIVLHREREKNHQVKYKIIWKKKRRTLNRIIWWWHAAITGFRFLSLCRAGRYHGVIKNHYNQTSITLYQKTCFSLFFKMNKWNEFFLSMWIVLAFHLMVGPGPVTDKVIKLFLHFNVHLNLFFIDPNRVHSQNFAWKSARKLLNQLILEKTWAPLCRFYACIA